MKKVGAVSAILLIVTILVMTALPTFAMQETEGYFDIYNDSDDKILVRIDPIEDAPALSVSEVYVDDMVTVTGTFDEPGIHRYSVYQVPGNDPDVIYDDRVYTVVFCAWVNEADELQVTVVVYLDGQDEKPETLRFRNTLCEQPTPPPTDTPEPTPTPPPTPHTGAPAMYGIGVAFIVAAAVMLTIVAIRRRAQHDAQ